MKVKIFNTNINKEKLNLEESINTWLDENKSIKINQIKQSSCGGSWAESEILISIWYEDC